MTQLIKRLQVDFNSGNNDHDVSLTATSTRAADSLVYDSTQSRLNWNLDGTDPQGTVTHGESVDFASYGSSDIVEIYITADQTSALKGGIIIKQTTYPPKIVENGVEPEYNPVNTIALGLGLSQFKITDSAGVWSISCTVEVNGTGVEAGLNGLSLITLKNGEKVLWLHVVNGTNQNATITLSNNAINAVLGERIPIIISDTQPVAGNDYYKEGTFLFD